ncbi:MAG: hypothetical protein AAF447_15585 [Myxococcota bacterium]
MAWLALALSACGDAEPAAPAGTRLEYRFDFDWEAAALVGDTRVVETNLGFRVGIERLYVAVGALELVPCTEEATLEAAWRFLGPSVAYADHGWTSDATRLEPRLVENVFGDVSLLGPVEASGAAYCEFFWTLTPVEGAASDGVELERISLLFEGWVEGPGTAERRALDAELRVGRGALVPLTDNWAPGRDRVRVTRYPARALDDIAFDTEPTEDALFEFALQLLRGAEVRFEAG